MKILIFFFCYNVHQIAQRKPTLAAEVSGEFLLKKKGSNYN